MIHYSAAAARNVQKKKDFHLHEAVVEEDKPRNYIPKINLGPTPRKRNVNSSKQRIESLDHYKIPSPAQNHHGSFQFKTKRTEEVRKLIPVQSSEERALNQQFGQHIIPSSAGTSTLQIVRHNAHGLNNAPSLSSNNPNLNNNLSIHPGSYKIQLRQSGGNPQRDESITSNQNIQSSSRQQLQKPSLKNPVKNNSVKLLAGGAPVVNGNNSIDLSQCSPILLSADGMSQFGSYLKHVYTDLIARDNGFTKNDIGHFVFIRYANSSNLSLLIARRLFILMATSRLALHNSRDHSDSPKLSLINNNQAEAYSHIQNSRRFPGNVDSDFDDDQGASRHYQIPNAVVDSIHMEASPSKSIRLLNKSNLNQVRVEESPFIKMLVKLYTGTDQELKEFVFQLFDIHQRGLVSKQDLRLFLFHPIHVDKPGHDQLRSMFDTAITNCEMSHSPCNGANNIGSHQLDLDPINSGLSASNFADIARIEALKQLNLKKVLIDKILDGAFGEGAADGALLRRDDFMTAVDEPEGGSRQDRRSGLHISGGQKTVQKRRSLFQLSLVPRTYNRAYMVLVRTVVDYIKLMMPCSYQFEKIMIKDFKRTNLAKIKQQQLLQLQQQKEMEAALKLSKANSKQLQQASSKLKPAQSASGNLFLNPINLKNLNSNKPRRRSHRVQLIRKEELPSNQLATVDSLHHQAMLNQLREKRRKTVGNRKPPELDQQAVQAQLRRMGKTIDARKKFGANAGAQQLDEVEEGSSDEESSSSSHSSQSNSDHSDSELEGSDKGSRDSDKFDILRNQWDSKQIIRNKEVIEQVIADIDVKMRLHRQRTAKFKDLPSLDNKEEEAAQQDDRYKPKQDIISFMQNAVSMDIPMDEDIDEMGDDEEAPNINMVNQPLVHNVKSNFSKLKTRAFCVKPTVFMDDLEDENMAAVSEGSDLTVQSRIGRFSRSRAGLGGGASGFLLGSRKGLKFGTPFGRNESFMQDKSELLNMPCSRDGSYDDYSQSKSNNSFMIFSRGGPGDAASPNGVGFRLKRNENSSLSGFNILVIKQGQQKPQARDKLLDTDQAENSMSRNDVFQTPMQKGESMLLKAIMQGGAIPKRDNTPQSISSQNRHVSWGRDSKNGDNNRPVSYDNQEEQKVGKPLRGKSQPTDPKNDQDPKQPNFIQARKIVTVPINVNSFDNQLPYTSSKNDLNDQLHGIVGREIVVPAEPQQSVEQIFDLSYLSLVQKRMLAYRQNQQGPPEATKFKVYYVKGDGKPLPQTKLKSIFLMIKGPELLAFKSEQGDKCRFIHCLPDCYLHFLEIKKSMFEKKGKMNGRSKTQPLRELQAQAAANAEAQADQAGDTMTCMRARIKIKISEGHKRVFFLSDLFQGRDFHRQLQEAISFWKVPAELSSQRRYRYHMDETQSLLGEGSFGKVFKMIDTHTGLLVAVKVIHKRRLTPLEYDFMLSEIEIMRTLSRENNPLIVKMLDVFDDTQTQSIVMELVEGQTLLKWLTEIHKDNDFNEKTTQKVFKQICIALDIKLENALILDPHSPDPVIKLLDFGLSAVLLQGERRQQPVGSVAFLSPEIVREQPHDFATDVWSMGIVLYTLLTGRMPFVTKTKDKTLFNIKYKDINLKQPQWDNVSKDGKNLLSKMLTKNQKERVTIDQVLNHPWMLQ